MVRRRTVVEGDTCRAVQTLKKRTGIKSFGELGLYKPKRRKKPTIKGTLRGSIGLGFG